MRHGPIAVLALLVSCMLPACRKTPPVAELETVSPPPSIALTVDRPLPSISVLPAFTSVAKELGIDFTFYSDEVKDRFFLPEVMGGGAAWFDYDLDGCLDLYLVNGSVLAVPDPLQSQHLNGLYRGDGRRFQDVASKAAVTHGGGYGQGCCVGDFDADGFPDLYLANFGPNRLYKNNGDGTFQEVSGVANVADPQWSTSPVWVDLNDDRLLDLFVVNYMNCTLANIVVCDYSGKPGYCGPGKHEAVPDRAYLNCGDGTFEDATASLGLVGPDGKGLAVAIVDFDGDAKPEIYVGNDMANNFLYRRKGAGNELRYEDIADAAGCSASADGSLIASMGLSCADFDGDGLVDIFVTNFYAKGNVLFRNLGDLLFVDDRRRARVAAVSFQNLGFGTVPFDYDRDGARDLFVTNGNVLGPGHTPFDMHPQLLHNDGSGRFDDVSAIAGAYFKDLWLGRGAAGGDYDNDGDIDLAVTHLHRPVALLRNDTKTVNRFIGFDLRGADRLPPLGGRIVVSAGERDLVVPVVGAGSYLCDGDPRIVVGLGAWDRPVGVEVFWPSGHVDRFSGLPTGRYWRIKEHGVPESPWPQMAGATSNDL